MLKIPGITFESASTPGEVKLNMLLNGHFGAGKTHVAGSACRMIQDAGKEAVYLALPGEDPFATLSRFGLETCIYQAQTAREVEGFISKVKAGNIDLLVIDSLFSLYRLALDILFGKGASPKEAKEWGLSHDRFTSMLTGLQGLAPVTISLCPADRSADTFINPDQKKPNIIGSNLPGKFATQIAGFHTHVGYLTQEVDKETKQVHREISFVPGDSILTRANGLVRPMVEPIVLDGVEAWSQVLDALASHQTINE